MSRSALALLASLIGCGSSDPVAPVQGVAAPDVIEAADVPPAVDLEPLDTPAVELDVPPPPPTWCSTRGYAEIALQPGPYGIQRHDRAEDFTVLRLGAPDWTLSVEWKGCESYVFVPDTLAVSDLDKTSVWASDLDALVAGSPNNVHYFFVSRLGGAAATASLDAMRKRVDAVVKTLSDAEHWASHLHVVTEAPGWLATVLAGHGKLGFAVDRAQRVRGIGSLADVTRSSKALQDKGAWPWMANLAYAAHEARRFNFEAAREERLAKAAATVVTLWSGDVLAGFAEKDVALPSDAALAEFDTLEVDVSMQCPNADAPEPGNCGAWDYLAHLSVADAAGQNVELARFITSYHRENRMVVDVSQMLPHLAAGGTRHFRWEFAPEWNTQPTATTLSLRFSKAGKPSRPSEVHFLWAGGGFGKAYNDAHPPMTVAIPSDAKRVELVAVITGHGAGKSQCAEFCNHQHEFTVGGEVFLLDQPAVGSEDGCIAEIERGMVPNQYGTWWFGRGGWCPGQQVEPFVVDVSALAPAGETVSVAYRGLLKGKTPPDGAGDIVMSSSLVVYR